MIWNVHTGYADNGYDNYELAATFLQDMQVGAFAHSQPLRVVSSHQSRMHVWPARMYVYSRCFPKPPSSSLY